jgi:organic radical activating enzyme
MINSLRGIHIEPTNICTLKCPGCARTRFIDQWPQHWRNHSLDIDQVLRFLDLDLTGRLVSLCGNYGDPIYHPEFIEFIRQLKQRGAVIFIGTNGSYKKQDWWEELVDNLDSADGIMFSVDGTPENFTEYRINADWESIRVGMDVVARAKCHSVWKYIPFAFNQNNIESVKKLSEEIGIKEFQVEFSDRFDEQTQYLIPDVKLTGLRYQPQVQWHANNNLTVDPKCQNNQEHFITADGYYSPCCFIADHRFYYKTIFGKNKPKYNIQDHTLSEILQQESTVKFYQNLDQHTVCQYACPKTTD